VQVATVDELQNPRIGIECSDLAFEQIDLGRAAQRLQFHPAVRGAETATDQPWQHAGIPGLGAGAEQGDTTWWAFHQGPAAQHSKMGMTSPGQDQVVPGHGLLQPSRY
jgi:hypothetical protein